MKLNHLILIIFSVALVIMCFVTSYVAIYFAGRIEHLYWEDQINIVKSSVHVATRIANYQGQRVRFENKDLDRAKADTIRLIKETLSQRTESSLYVWIGNEVAGEKDAMLFSSVPMKELEKLKEMVGDISLYFAGKKAFEQRDYIVFSLHDWGWYGVAGFDPQVLRDEISKIKVRIYLFFLFLVSVLSTCIVSLLYFTLKNYQKVEMGYNRECFIFKSSPDYLVLLDINGRVVDISKTMMDKIRVKPEEVLNIPVWDTAWWDHSTNSRHKITKAFEACRDKKIVNFFSQHPTGLGENLHVHHRIIPLTDETDNVAYILDWGMDADWLDQRIQHRNELNSCASYFFENASEAFIVHGVQRGIIVANLAAQKLFAVKEVGELIGNSLADLAPQFQLSGEESSAELTEAFAITMGKGEYTLKWQIKTCEGKFKMVKMAMMRGVLGQDQVIYISFSNFEDLEANLTSE